MNFQIQIVLMALLGANLARAVNWNGNNWALGCDFSGNDLTNSKVISSECGGLCAKTSGCTHFVWSPYDGVCYMKKNAVSKSNAFDVSNQSFVCGVMDSGSSGSSNNGVAWNGNNWALGCDFNGNDLSNSKVAGSECGGLCAKTSGCTHFVWTSYNGGTCWMKKGSISKSNAISVSDKSQVCGVNDGSSGGSTGGNTNPPSNSGIFPFGKFKVGRNYQGGVLTNTPYDYATIWIGYGNKNGNYDLPSEAQALVKEAVATGKTPVFYAYIAAFQAKEGWDLHDCDVDPVVNLCVKGNSYIKNNRDKILANYAGKAKGIASIIGNNNIRPIFLIEPDFWQYYGDNRQETYLGGDYLRALFDDMCNTIKASLPNALISWDISAWIGEQGMKTWWNFFSSSPHINFIHTSGGQARGDLWQIKPNELSWSFVHSLTGKPIIADCGYGVNGASDNNCNSWYDNNVINARVADGVVAVTTNEPKRNPSDYKPNV